MTALFDLTAESPAAHVAAGPGPFTVALPVGLELINANQSQHRARRARIVKEIRSKTHEAVTDCPALMEALAAAKPGPLFQRAHILGILHPATARRADPANWYPSFKAAVDGIVDAGVLDDDNHEHVAGPDMRLGPKVKGGQIVLVVTALGTGEDPLGAALAGCAWPDREQVTR